MTALETTYTVLGSIVALTVILRFFVAPVMRASATLKEHSTKLDDFGELLEATVVIVLDTAEDLRTISTELGIGPALKLAHATRERRVAERRQSERRTGS